MGKSLARKLIESHLVEGEPVVGQEIGITIDQTLTQDATGTLVMLEFEAMGVPHVRTELSAQYVDHNLLQTDFKNPDDHVFLRSACQRFGLWYSRPGNGVSHPIHQERFGKPGKTLLGSDSHTPAAGAIGMLALGAGGLEVAMAMAGRPYHLQMPKVWAINLVGRLPDWVSAKDIILEMLRRHGVDGAVGSILEYHGPGLATLSAMDRHVIANMGTELGATSTVFPADSAVHRFLRAQGREQDYTPLSADPAASYDQTELINLSELVPLIALPSSPGNVVPVREVEGRRIYQAYLGSSANPGFRDFGIAAKIVDGRQVHESISFDINPASRQTLEALMAHGYLQMLTHAGARVHQAGCNGCIGMGQAPASGGISLRTVPRNFPGRSGTRNDAVYLCSPETVAASALTGRITDPRDLQSLYAMSYPHIPEPISFTRHICELTPPPPKPSSGGVPELEKGPNIVSLPQFDALPASLDCPVLLKLGDDVSTDEIMPAGARILPFRSNIPELSKFVFETVDPTFFARTLPHRGNAFVVVAGVNYGQGSSREHAALAPRFLGLRVVLAISFARIHHQNLANFGILPLTFCDAADYDRIESGDQLRFEAIRDSLAKNSCLTVRNTSKGQVYQLRHNLSVRQLDMVRAGGLINLVRTGCRKVS